MKYRLVFFITLLITMIGLSDADTLPKRAIYLDQNDDLATNKTAIYTADLVIASILSDATLESLAVNKPADQIILRGIWWDRVEDWSDKPVWADTSTTQWHQYWNLSLNATTYDWWARDSLNNRIIAANNRYVLLWNADRADSFIASLDSIGKNRTVNFGFGQDIDGWHIEWGVYTVPGGLNFWVEDTMNAAQQTAYTQGNIDLFVKWRQYNEDSSYAFTSQAVSGSGAPDSLRFMFDGVKFEDNWDDGWDAVWSGTASGQGVVWFTDSLTGQYKNQVPNFIEPWGDNGHADSILVFELAAGAAILTDAAFLGEYRNDGEFHGDIPWYPDWDDRYSTFGCGYDTTRSVGDTLFYLRRLNEQKCCDQHQSSIVVNPDGDVLWNSVVYSQGVTFLSGYLGVCN